MPLSPCDRSRPDEPELSGPELAGPRWTRRWPGARCRRQRRRRPGERRAAAGGRRLRGYSGPGPDPRDPQPFGAVLGQLVKARGWQKPAAEATGVRRVGAVVGADVAAHCRPVKLEDGELTVEAESTAWATQLRLLAAKLLGPHRRRGRQRAW